MRPKLLTILWLLTDYLLFLAAYAVAYFLRVGFIFSTDFPFDRHMQAAAITGVAWLLVMATTRTYSFTRNQNDIRNLAYIQYAAAFGTAVFALTYYFLFGVFFSRMLLLIAFALTAVITTVWHMAFERYARTSLTRTPPTFPTLIVGVTRESTAFIELLIKRKNPLKPVAILDATGVKEKEIHGVPVLGKLNKLEETLTTHRITHLIQCSDLEQSLNLLSACRNRKITYLLLPSVLGIVERDERIETIEGHGVVAVSG